MDPNQGNGTSQVAAKVPTNVKAALQKIAFDRSTPHDTVGISDILRDAIRDWLRSQDPNDIPEEARDLLDDDLLANAGGNGGS